MTDFLEGCGQYAGERRCEFKDVDDFDGTGGGAN